MKNQYFADEELFELFQGLDEFETFENEWSNESWGSQLYTAWVQHSLNQIMGLKLAVDGDLGKQTKSAIRSFQQQNGLVVDGKVGSNTEQQIVQVLNRLITANPLAICASLRQPEILDKFDFDSDRVKPHHLPQISHMAQCVVASLGTLQPVRSIRLVGHTDPVGSDAYNLDLGRRRAEQVKLSLQTNIDRLSRGLSGTITFQVETRGETQPVVGSAASTRRVEVLAPIPVPARRCASPSLSTKEQAEFDRLSVDAQKQFIQLRATIETYTGVACREADRGSRSLLQRGVFRALPNLLPEILELAYVTVLPRGWKLNTTRPLLVGNVLYNLAFPETINQGGTDRLGGRPDPTCYSASTQMLLARRYPATYVRLTVQLATTSRCTFSGGDTIGPLTFRSTSLYKSLESVLLQTAFDVYFKTKARSGAYVPGDELKLHRQVFGSTRPPHYVTYRDKKSRVTAFRKAFIVNGGNTPAWEIVNLCTGDPTTSCGNHTVVLTRISGGRVYFYNPWANEEERNSMFGTAAVSISGKGERPAESSMIQADFENQLTAVFHN